MGSKSASVQYRYLKNEDYLSDFNLKEVVVDVLGRAGSTGDAIGRYAKLRVKDLDQDGSFVVLNKISSSDTWSKPFFCGQLIHVKSGAELPGITGDLNEEVTEFELQTLNIGERNQIVQGVLYFAIVGNHVGLIEGQRTRGATLERYLTRLMQDAGELDPGQNITLNAKLEGKLKEVSQMTLSPQKARGQTGQSSSDAVDTTTGGASAETAGATVLDLLRQMGWDDRQIQQLEASIPADGWIEGKLNVLFKAKRGRRSAVSAENLEEALRNLDPKSVGLLGEDGRERGGAFKLSTPASVETIGDLLDPESAMTAIVDMLQRWSRGGRIDCAL